MKRRDFIKHGLHSLSVISVFPLSNAYAKTSSEKVSQSVTLSAFLDTLIPADSTPSASQLSMDKELISYAQNIHNYPKLITLGCQWLDSQSKLSFDKPFVSLKNIQQEMIVQLAEKSSAQSIPQIFFTRIKNDLFRLYYSDPASWVNLGINSPPQPKGYPNYTQLPYTHG